MLDRVTGMRVFVQVATRGSLSAAARSLGMSQTMATKHLAAIEGRLGTKLLHRTTRRLTLTEAGRNYLDAVERILTDLDEADAAASVETIEVRGTLRLNAPISFGIRELTPLLTEFSRLYPSLQVEFGLNDRQVDLVEEGWDLVIRIGALKDSTLVARRLASCRTVVCASPTYLSEHGSPKTIAELKRHNCLGYTLSRTVGPNLWTFGRDGKMTVAVKGSFISNNGDALVAAAVLGQGIVYQPTFLVADELKTGTLRQLKLDHPTIDIYNIYAAYPASRRPPAKVRALVDFLAARLGPVPRWDRRLEAQ